jgi:nucleotide-binding universal stress UspA family protein
MIKDVLVCLEGSASSEAATQIAIGIAHEVHAQLAGLAIVDEPADARTQAKGWIASFERRCREQEVPARTFEVVGLPADRVLSKMISHDVTVIGRDANFKFETERQEPQTREQILRRGVRPVLLVPEGTQTLGNRVLIAYDGSGAAKRAAVSFASSGLEASRELHVATVDDDNAAAWDMAHKGVALLRRQGVYARGHNVVSTLSNFDALFELASDLGVGLIVMGALSHSRLAHLFHQSAMRGLIEKSAVPLYMHH